MRGLLKAAGFVVLAFMLSGGMIYFFWALTKYAEWLFEGSILCT